MSRDFRTVLELVRAFPDEQSCIDHLEDLRWGGKVISPFAALSKVYVCKNNRFRCKETNKYFTAKTGTLFDNSKLALQKWFLAIWLITSQNPKISSTQLSKDVGVTQKTAWLMLQKIKTCFDFDNENDSSKTEQ